MQTSEKNSKKKKATQNYFCNKCQIKDVTIKNLNNGISLYYLTNYNFIQKPQQLLSHS